MLIGRGNRVGSDAVLIWHRLTTHLYAHIAARDAKGHQVGVDCGPLLGHEHFLIAPFVGLVLRRIGSRRMSEPEVCGGCGETAKVGIDDGLAASALEVELGKTRDALVTLWSLNLHAIPSVGGETHLRDNLQAGGLAPCASLCDAVLKKHGIGLAVLDADIECDVAIHFWCQQSRA